LCKPLELQDVFGLVFQSYPHLIKHLRRMVTEIIGVFGGTYPHLIKHLADR